MTKDEMQHIINIADNGVEAKKLIGVVDRLAAADLLLLNSMIKLVNDATRACWDETNGKLLMAYDQKAASQWARLGALIQAIVALGGPATITQLIKPKRIAIICADGYVVDSGFNLPANFQGHIWHALAPDKEFALATVERGEADVLALLMHNNQ